MSTTFYRTLAVLWTAMMLLLSATTVAPTATADDFNKCNANTGCRPDNFEHTYCLKSSFGTKFSIPIKAAMESLDSQTKYFDTFMTSCTSKTDVVWESSTSITARGDYLCLEKNGSGNCERARVRLNPDILTNSINIRKTACHEIGHSGGLSHGVSTGCMKNGAVTVATTTYNNHHVTHLDNRK